MTKTVLYLLVLPLLTLSCVSRTNETDLAGTERTPGKLEIQDEAMNDIVENISSPIETPSFVKELGVPFSSRYLVNIDNIEDLTSGFTMAFNLGMLSADLGYLNVYDKTGSALNYLSAIRKLADGLKVSEFFEYSTIKRLATNDNNIDSLMYLSVYNFNQMDNHLRESDRSNLSAIMIAGVWIEGMYLATQVALENPGEKIAEYIGEQKLILNYILLILKNYEKDAQFKRLITDFESIKKTFQEVNITYVMGDPVAVEKDGMLTVVQQESSVVSISPVTVQNIGLATERVRNHQHMK